MEVVEGWGWVRVRVCRVRGGYGGRVRVWCQSVWVINSWMCIKMVQLDGIFENLVLNTINVRSIMRQLVVR